MVRQLFPFLTTSCPSVKLQCRSLSRFGTFQNVAVAAARMQIPKYAIFFLECLISKCCCGTREAQNFELRHYRSTFVTIKIIKQRQGNASKLECLIFVAERPSSVLAKFHSKYKPFLECLILFVSINFSELLYFLRKSQHLLVPLNS